MRSSNQAPRLPLRPLAAAFALVLVLDAAPALATPEAPRGTAAVVSNCDDSGAGSLRDAVLNAADGDTIDLTQLTCSVISLTTGSILIGATGLTLQGPGGHGLMIDGSGNGHQNLIYDIGGGALAINGIDLAFGAKYQSTSIGRGGCVYTNGDLNIHDSHVYACGVHSYAYDASGGALYAQGVLTIIDTDIELCGLTTSAAARGGGVFAGAGMVMINSRISGCRIASSDLGYGGGIYARGGLFMKYSTVSDNLNDDAPGSLAGGVYVHGDTAIYWSTISGNSAGNNTGGIYLAHDAAAASTALIVESTISGNTAFAPGGINAGMPLRLVNSTIAFNRIAEHFPVADYAWSAGLAVAADVTMESSIVANNVSGDESADIGGFVLENVVSGSHNLVTSSARPMPVDTIFDDPRLLPLADNGGPTQTHELRSGSPAIDLGEDGGFDTDQRGPGFPRVLGAAADIGAYEADPDRVFHSGFD
jgi:hypothetical protein